MIKHPKNKQEFQVFPLPWGNTPTLIFEDKLEVIKKLNGKGGYISLLMRSKDKKNITLFKVIFYNVKLSGSPLSLRQSNGSKVIMEGPLNVLVPLEEVRSLKLDVEVHKN